MADLPQIESICEVFYNQPGSPDWSTAKEHLDMLTSAVDQVPKLQQILDQSSQPFALLMAASSLKNLYTGHWNNFSADEHLATRDYLLRYLAEKGPTVPPFVMSALLALLCRIAKLGWFEDPRQREIVTELTKFLSASVGHCDIGLRALNLLTTELNTPTSGFTLTQHRKSAVAFRDKSLLEIGNLALGILKQLATDAMPGASAPQKGSLGHQALSLLSTCFSFDFIGTNPDESGDDVGAIQIPAAWRPVVVDPATTALLFGLYRSAEPPLSNSAMECLVLLSSVRRSLFRTEAERAQFLEGIMGAILEVLRDGTGLQHRENYHEFCRLLGRLKSNYQLAELMATPHYRDCMEFACRFSESSFSQWNVAANSLGYILLLWVRLVAAVPYVDAPGRHVTCVSDGRGTFQDGGGGGSGGGMSDGSPGGSRGPMSGSADDGGATGSSVPNVALLERCVVRVGSAFLDAMLGSVAAVAADPGTFDDPLEDEAQVAEQLEKIPSLFRYKYPELAPFVLSRFDPCLTRYQQVLQHQDAGGSGAGAGGASLEAELEVCEGQLTWLCYFVGAILSGQTWSTGTVTKGVNERLDGQLAARALQLVSAVDYRLEASSGSSRCGEKLALSLLYFMSNFRKAYLNDAPLPLSLSAGSTLSAMGTPLIDLAWDSELPGGPMTLRQRGTAIMFQTLDRGDQTAVTNILMGSVLASLRYWGDSEEVVGSTLRFFLDLSASANAAQSLAALPSCQTLVSHHSEAHLPFLAVPSNRRLRTLLHASLARLVFLQPPEGLDAAFSAFAAPFLTVLRDLCGVQSAAALRADPRVKPALMGVCRDLRGVCQATTTKRTYMLLFDALYPAFFPIFSRAAEAFADDPDVVNALLKFLTELVSNKGQRCSFGNTSPNGFLLFRECSGVVVAFAQRALAASAAGQDHRAQGGDLYRNTYKGYATALRALKEALSGGYVNFAVFSLYGDRCLSDALDAAVRLILDCSLEHILSYLKLSRWIFALLEEMFHNHLPYLAQLDTATFMKIIEMLYAGLCSLDPPMSSFCSYAVEYLASYLFTHRDKGLGAEVAGAAAGGPSGVDRGEGLLAAGGGGASATLGGARALAGSQAECGATMARLRVHLAANPRLFPDLTVKLFEQLLFGPYANHWTVTRPMLSIMLADETCFATYRSILMATQSPENQAQLAQCFDRLFADVEKNLEINNRDRFAQRLANFRQRVREFLTF